VKALLYYLVLLGVPVLGVLQLGQKLTAPKALEGAWTFDPSGVASEVSACPMLAGVGQLETLAITQSGPKLTLKLGELQVAGQIDAPYALRRPLIVVEADVRSQGAVPGMIQGTLTFPTCPASPTLAFNTFRQPFGQEGG